MRTIKLIFIIPCVLFVFSACQKDNYSGPNAGIYGALTDGQLGGTLQLSQAGSGGNVRMIVNDPAKYAAPSTQDLQIKADGSYVNTVAFAENYLVFPLYQSGPYQYLPTAPNHIQGDTLKVNLPAGQQTQVNFKVNPFYYVSTPAVVDSTVTFTITKSTTTTFASNLTSSNNLLILVNNYPIVNESISSNGVGKYYQNQFPFTVTASSLGAPYTPLYVIPANGSNPAVTTTYSFPWRLTHLPKGNYYLRIAVLGAGSNGKWNYSPTVAFTIH